MHFFNNVFSLAQKGDAGLWHSKEQISECPLSWLAGGTAVQSAMGGPQLAPVRATQPAVVAQTLLETTGKL